MAWAMVIVAGLFETAFAISLKLSAGFSRLGWSLAFISSAAISFGLLSWALRSLPVGSAYAVWTGIGAAGTVLFGMLFLDESSSPVKILSVSLIVAGVIGLNLSGAANH